MADALNQLHVLLPVLDESKHYWQGPDEVDKLMRSGAGWLASHPDMDLITRRYLGRSGGLTRVALARVAELGDEVEEAVHPAEDEEVLQPEEKRVPLNRQRHDAVCQVLRELEAKSVIDLGCGPGQFLERLVKTPAFTKITGVDVSTRSLQVAARRLQVERMSERQSVRVDLFQGALTYQDDRFVGFDAAVLMEVVEHVDPPRLEALERVVFGAAKPRAVIVTTPNRECNVTYDGEPHATMCYMRTVTHREMRNNSSDILRAVAAGEVVRVTNNGRIAAVISPPNEPTLRRLVAEGQARPARQPVQQLTTIKRRTSTATSADMLDDVRGRW